jgi:hypothetical protein
VCHQDVFCLTFTASYEELGVVKTVELRKGGASIAVTQDNKREFVAFLVDSVNIQFRNFARGFSMASDVVLMPEALFGHCVFMWRALGLGWCSP